MEPAGDAAMQCARLPHARPGAASRSPARTRREASLKVAESLKKKPFQASDPRSHTANRLERAELEAMALAEAFGAWLSEFTGRETRGSEGLMDDLRNGVTLSIMLMRLGIDVDRPRDPVRNAFEARENMQKVQTACRKAGFKCVPSVDVTDKSMLPTLLEAAAVCHAQNVRRDRDEAAGLLSSSHARRPSMALPAALVKRLGEVGDSPVVARAQEGALVPEVPASAPEAPPPLPAMVQEMSPAAVAALPPAVPSPSPPKAVKRVSIESNDKLIGGESPSVKEAKAVKRVSIDSSDRLESQSSPKPSPLLMARKKVDAAAAPKERARSASEIPQSEKDDMLNKCLLATLALVLFWFLFLR